MVNEALNEDNKVMLEKDEKEEDDKLDKTAVFIETPNKQSSITITAFPLSDETRDFLIHHGSQGLREVNSASGEFD